MSDIFPETPLTSLPDAVTAMGALPVPVGSAARTLDVVEDELTGVSLSLYEEELTSERLRWALASAKRGRARLRAQVAALLEERRTTNEALDDAVQALRADRDDCSCPPADHPHQVGCPLDLPAPGASEHPVNKLKGTARLNASAAAAAEATHWKRLGIEDPHDGPLAHSYRVPHDLPDVASLPVPETCRLDAAGLDEVGQHFLGGAS